MDPLGGGMPANMFSSDPQQMSDMVRQMRSNPMVQVMLNNPELLREALHNNPAIRQVRNARGCAYRAFIPQIMDANPQVAQMLLRPHHAA